MKQINKANLKKKKNSKFIIGRVANRLTNNFYLFFKVKIIKTLLCFFFSFFLGETTSLCDSYY